MPRFLSTDFNLHLQYFFLYLNIRISLPGKGEEDIAVVFIDGEKAHTLKGEIFPKFKEIIVDYIEKKFLGAHGQT